MNEKITLNNDTEKKRERGDTTSDKIKQIGSTTSGGIKQSAKIPKNWDQMDAAYALTDEDEKNGLKETLYTARDIAAKSIDNLFSSLEIEKSSFDYMHDIPIGIDDDFNAAAYKPGVYGIVLGRESEEVKIMPNCNTEEKNKIQNRLATSIAHEMIHSFQTVSSPFLGDSFDTIGNTVMGWSGIEEGMTEALANISVEMQLKNTSLEESAQRLENFCAQHDVPATQVSARLIRKMNPEQLKWYLTCAQTGEIRNDYNNELSKIFGPYYKDFCKNMVQLYGYECYHNLNKEQKQNITDESIMFVDEATSK